MVERPEVEDIEVCKASRDCPSTFGNLVGIREVQLSPVGDAWRAQRNLPSADERILDCQWEEKIRLADHVVIEEIIDAGAESIGIKYPATPRNGHAKLRFLISLAGQGDESAVALHCKD